MQRERLHHLQERIHQAFEDADAGGDSFLVFQVGAELCAVEFKKISSVLACGQITQLWARYTMPNSVLGVCALGENILTVIDAGLVYGYSASRISLKSRLLTFADVELKDMALLVDRVLDPMTLSELDELQPPAQRLDQAKLLNQITNGPAQ